MTDSESQQHLNRELGGYKAALHNPNVSAEAKEHVAAKLEEHGIAVDESHISHIPAHDQAHHEDVVKNQGHSFEHHSAYHTRHGEDQHKDEAHVIAGYRATLKNPNVSAEVKAETARKLLDLGHAAVIPANRPEDYDEQHKDNAHVIGGYKATLSNPNTSEEAKQHAREQLKAHGIDV